MSATVTPLMDRINGHIAAHQANQPSPYSEPPASGVVAAATRRSVSALDVLSQWEIEGPLEHQPTGFPTLDDRTDGGPAYGTRWYFMGAPDAGKTLVLVQVVDIYLGDGLAVGMLCVDEEPGDVMCRFLQRRGFTRAELEKRDPRTLQMARDRAPELRNLHMYDSTWTIERAAADLASKGARRMCLTVDSVQTVTCDAEAGENLSVREAVTARAQAIRAVAMRYRLIALATSEMGRGAYRSFNTEDIDDIASAKESGAIEYSARVLLALRSVKKHPDMLELRIAKNKHGARGEAMGLRLSRRLQQLEEAELPTQSDGAETRETARITRESDRNLKAAVTLAHVLVEKPGVSARNVLPALRAKMGSCSDLMARAAAELLGSAIVVVHGPNRTQKNYLDGAALPPEVVALADGPLRTRLVTSRPPSDLGDLGDPKQLQITQSSDPRALPFKGGADQITGSPEVTEGRDHPSDHQSPDHPNEGGADAAE